jgi:serine protease Do
MKCARSSAWDVWSMGVLSYPAAVVMMAFMMAFASGCSRNAGDAVAADAAAPPSGQTPPRSDGGALPDFTGLVKQYGGAVVNVTVVGRRSTASGGPEDLPDDPLSEFFRRFGIPGPNGPGAPGGPPLRGLGSGFIVSEDGYVITNAHVVSEAADVTVRLPDRREYPAKVIGVDLRSDIAVLKVDAKNLPTVKIAKAGNISPGEWVAAIGSPFGFENSVTVGVVSATARALGPQSSVVPFIQTDVAVNPGNSGGPLFNLRGEVIGVNSQIYSATGGYQGISFAIPIDVAMDVQRQLVQTGRVTRGRIGVTIQDVNQQLAESFRLDRPRGALISSVEPGGPAAKAGLKPGDVILSVNDETIETSTQLPALVANLKPGTRAPLRIWRNGQEEKVTVQVAELKDEAPMVASASERGQGGSQEDTRLGLGVRPLTPEEQAQLGTEGSLVVEQVQGPAAAAGVQPGDVILAVGNSPVRSVEDVRKASRKSKGSVALLIERDNARIYVPVRIG